MERDCIFCKIARGEIPARVVHEDELCVAFEDVSPRAPVHLLVVPRRHIASLAAAERNEGELLGHLLGVVTKVAKEAGVAESGFRTVINTNRDGGQEVMHLHLHVMGGERLGPPC